MDYEEAQRANEVWRQNHSPREDVAEALQEAVTAGEIDAETREALVDDLYTATSETLRDTDRHVGENRLLAMVERRPDGILLRITEELWRMQPLGVICETAHHRVNGEGSAVIADISPRSETVAEDVMPVEHVALTIVPTPVWIARYMGGEGGFPTVE